MFSVIAVRWDGKNNVKPIELVIDCDGFWLSPLPIASD